MNEECLLCAAPLAYLETDELMECAVCHKKENSKTRCVNGHYVCNECHTKGVDAIIGIIKRPGQDCKEAYGSAVLSYARTGTSYHGWRRAADGIQKCRRRY